jgi:hypothetical protein
VLVTADGYEWLSRVIPIEIDEIIELASQPSSFEAFVGKAPGAR